MNFTFQSYFQTYFQEDYNRSDDKQKWREDMLDGEYNLYENVHTMLWDFRKDVSDSIIRQIDFTLLFSDLQEYCANNP